MSAAVAEKAVNWFISNLISGAEYDININFFGGEPFLELDRMEQIIALGRMPRPNTYKHLHFSATTNATVASDRVERIIRGSNMRLLVSMDGGHGPSRYRPFVSGKSSYPYIVRNLPKLVQWASDTMVRMTFHPESLDLVGNIRHAFDLGAPCVALAPVAEADWRGYEQALEDAYMALAEWFIQEARHGVILPIFITHDLLRTHHRALQGAPRPARACSVGSTLLGVDPQGHVMPCHRFIGRRQDWLGTVDDPQLPASREQYVSLSSRTLLGCDTCAAEPICGGGCRLVALQAGLDLHTGAHPGYCLAMRAHAAAVRRIYATLTAENNQAFLRSLRHERPMAPLLRELSK